MKQQNSGNTEYNDKIRASKNKLIIANKKMNTSDPHKGDGHHLKHKIQDNEPIKHSNGITKMKRALHDYTYVYYRVISFKTKLNAIKS